ncbi:hypothetical protein [Goodfellowiella coeruleoviolacea]|uniref:Uncharacterized protein n=1 Tax=Goodfellowiella coeruleoviolacea TaxID=334858 RepID=A0AAE3KGL3_9PSEU|nr:hypothetical protein [Goodfellowiella coeruleoviolacea]MCP2167376.1 hypothetical protein [Goodfellowiella coeruleoviolacea]
MNPAPANRSVHPGDRVYRVHWVLGTDRLRAVCHCSAEREFEDPVQLWEWLLSHPDGHVAPQSTSDSGATGTPERGVRTA